jgi:signal transduction histidine kinase
VLVTVNAQVERMTRLSQSLLALARADAGADTLQRERVDVAGIVNSAAGHARPAAEAKGLRVAIAGEGAPALLGDADLLLQLLLNLTDNAVRCTERGAVTIGWRDDGAGAPIELFVRDTGPGVPVEQRERIFDRFHRLDESRHGGGAGLGLAICRWIAEAHGGSIAVTSDGSGATFTVKLPRS